ncbi:MULTISPECIES: hypothetical protein [unclassified Microbacterium]|uniref:hypothetical protein n=1 Tax=unclassified Microbacterium TaxID=2609290 RepID=UPI000EA9F32E|nr:MULTISPECIES: hypothetical protein [unclassified Microbacterium]MBT2485003.1 hypothetical protein [Microbacterium sp. ISL-108]RKN67853.1 hypothetical protein D7252_09815 [Microbacterium sp. CGR2]
MQQWFAAGNGALDLSQSDTVAREYEIAVTPIVPGPPVLLFGEGAVVWRQLATAEAPPLRHDEGALAIVHDLEQMGLAVKAPSHPARLSALPRPWLSSFRHELVYALLQRVATAAGIDMVFIKGPTLRAQGLREREHSGDVDCWVLPGDDIRLAAAMRSWGWTPLILPFTGTTIGHSLTLVAGEWGCAIDVHTSFPGMRAHPDEAFRLLRESAEPRSFAGVRAWTPPRDVHAVLSALHDMRPHNGVAPSDHAVEKASTVLCAAGRGVVTVIDRLDAGYVLRAPLERSFAEVANRYNDSLPPRDWGLRMETASSLRHLKTLKFVPVRYRLRALVRLVWPTVETMRIALEDPRATHRTVFFARVKRVGVSARKLTARR